MRENSDGKLIDNYIAGFTDTIKEQLAAIRKIIRAAAPDAEEKISYKMPTYYLYGNLVHFAGYDGHIGFYPSPSGITAFEEKLQKYKYSKGAIQFPLDEPLPEALITDIVKYRVKENLEKATLFHA
ncbi:MAG: DUF1801 domain-containing protein [Spirochaetales bacterium]|nr:DUF1801 domain-containing protein [Spirochaetales bacterium]